MEIRESDLTASLPEAAEALKEWLASSAADVGSVQVIDVRVVLDEDSEGEPIVRYLVTLKDPSGETWPVEEVVEFHRRVDERALELGLRVPWHVGLEAQTQDDFDPSDLT